MLHVSHMRVRRCMLGALGGDVSYNTVLGMLFRLAGDTRDCTSTTLHEDTAVVEQLGISREVWNDATNSECCAIALEVLAKLRPGVYNEVHHMW